MSDDPSRFGGSASEEERRRRAERRRRRQEDAEKGGDAVEGAADLADLVGGNAPTPGFGGGGGRGGGNRYDSCDGFGRGGGGGGRGGGCDACDGNFTLLHLWRLSTLLLLVAVLVPERAGPLVGGAIRLYRRRLTRFTPACPGTPSCSAYALAAVETFGARRGLRAAVARLRGCGPDGQVTTATASTSTS